MKKLLIAVCLLVVMTVGVFLHCRFVEGLGGEVITLLERAEAAAESGDWVQAERLTGEAARLWEDKNAHLSMTMRHHDIDQICTGLAEARALLRHREVGEYAAVSARLRDAVRHLYEMERLTLTNLL